MAVNGKTSNHQFVLGNLELYPRAVATLLTVARAGSLRRANSLARFTLEQARADSLNNIYVGWREPVSLQGMYGGGCNFEAEIVCGYVRNF